MDELLSWVVRTINMLEDIEPTAGDPRILEIELAKLHVSTGRFN